jgi:glycosyltransferase involved in cell wall biosynthesis
MNKKICILTSAHPIDDVRVYHKITRSLAQEFEVIWIGPNIHYFEKELPNDGVTRLLFKNRKGVMGRLFNNYRVIKIFLKQKSIGYVYMPDPDLAFFFSFLGKLNKNKSIFDIHEVFHKDLLNRKVKGFLFPYVSKLVERLIKKIVRKIDITIGVSEKVLNYYVSDRKPYFIIRSCLPQNFFDCNTMNLKKKDIFTVVHGKNHIARGTLQVLEALSILKEKNVRCKVLMVEQEVFDNSVFKNYVKKFGIDTYIELHGGLPFAEMQKLMAQCHAGIIAYGRDLGVDSLPNRFFEYMAIGIPVIIPSFSGEMVNIVKKERCGILVDTEDPKKIAESMEYLIKNHEISNEMGDNGKIAFRNRHNWEIEIKPLINYLKLS